MKFSQLLQVFFLSFTGHPWKEVNFTPRAGLFIRSTLPCQMFPYSPLAVRAKLFKVHLIVAQTCISPPSSHEPLRETRGGGAGLDKWRGGELKAAMWMESRRHHQAPSWSVSRDCSPTSFRSALSLSLSFFLSFFHSPSGLAVDVDIGVGIQVGVPAGEQVGD